MTAGGVTWHDALGSTQEEAHRLAAEGAPHGAAVAARVQTGGRGTRGRLWFSPEGGLWLSVVCRPEESDAFEAVGLRVGLVLADLLDRQLRADSRVALKWPNDLLLDDRKLGGILAEARWHGERIAWIVVGVGINVRNELPSAVRHSGARLADAGFTGSPDELAEPVAGAVANAAARAAPLTRDELDQFARRDWLLGRAVAAPEQGVADGITPAGRLRVRLPDGRVAEILTGVVVRAVEPVP
ncbi:MAG TPA: biotin--[acetyl-CoA-carboxylase] ligase [Gemmatimonadales bacterium]|jgi:BirA family biotin operon repressor/biotin-[acetyl-CoA-carboxylase] ligase|nr:biotin--[acetyl-CoA-carboxylase] ligase [Gemmatimonadales bacterium]